MTPYPDTRPSRRGNASLPALALSLIALLCLALGSGGAPAAASDPAAHSGHGAAPAHHQPAPGPAEAGSEQDAAHVHVHPQPEAVPGEVGLEERLGEKIPLELTFRDESGAEVRLADLVRGPTIIAPVYYKCSNVCNFLQTGLASVLPEVKLTPGEQFQVLSVSFDETETPELAAKSKKMYFDAMGGRIPETSWRFLTGDLVAIHRLTEAAGYRFQRQGIDFLHPVVVFVVSPDGTIVRYLHGTSFLPMDLSLALMEAEEGRIGTTIRKLVTYCFSYDPEGKRYVFNLLRVSGTAIFLCAGGFMAYLIFGGKKKNPS